MRARWLGGLVVWLGVAGLAGGQPVVPPPPPPLVLPGAEFPVMPQGTLVSRPLQPVAPLELLPEPPPPTAAPVVVSEPVAMPDPLGRSWQAFELLLWWTKAQPLPPLVTASRTGALPILGEPNTVLLAGGRSLDSQDTAGLRIVWGWAVNDAHTAGWEVTYFFLGSRTYTADFSDLLGERYRVLGRPFVNAITGDEDVVPVAYPGVGSGLVTVATSSRVTGWEVSGVANLYAGPALRLNVSAGYRYFMANEGLRVEQTSLRFPLPGDVPGILAASADQIDAHNRFHGGQVGLHADLSRGPLFLQLAGKVALGRTVEVARISGQTVMYTGGSPLPLIQTFNAGVLGLPSNTGRLSQSAFAVLPEAQLKVGCQLGDRSHFYVGYSFIYLSDAIRPGDQVDRTLNPEYIPILPPPPNAGGLFGPDRPQLALVRSDFWVQGLLFGLEYRY
jgi:hypothetical protein